MAALQNKVGTFVLPTTHAFLETIAAAKSPLKASVSPIPVDPAGEGAYPIVSLTYLLFYETYDDPSKLDALRSVLDYCLTEGQKHSIKTGFIPLIEPLLMEAQKKVKTIRLN